MPAVCRFFLKGYCRYGNNCRFEHPGENDYSEPHQSYSNAYGVRDQQTATNFSFKSALSNIVPHATSFNSNLRESRDEGFSFASAFQSVPAQNTFKAVDVDMVEEIIEKAYKQQLLQQQQQQQQPQFGGLFSSSPFQQQQQPSYLQPQQSFLESKDTFGQAPRFQDASSNITTQGKSYFSDPQDLSEAELRAYERDKFEFRKIPIRPPPQTVCR